MAFDGYSAVGYTVVHTYTIQKPNRVCNPVILNHFFRLAPRVLKELMCHYNRFMLDKLSGIVIFSLSVRQRE